MMGVRERSALMLTTIGIAFLLLLAAEFIVKSVGGPLAYGIVGGACLIVAAIVGNQKEATA